MASDVEKLEDALGWLLAALQCGNFSWDADQRIAAEASYNEATRAVRALTQPAASGEVVDAETAADNAKAADRACLLAIASGYAWNGEAWARAGDASPQPDADTVRLDYIERTFSGCTNRERYLSVQMIWGKGCNGRSLREACDKYMARDAAIDSAIKGEK